jgi:hypothetical protein
MHAPTSEQRPSGDADGYEQSGPPLMGIRLGDPEG